MKSNLDHSVERLVDSQDHRARATGLGTTREARAVVRRHWKPLADRIASDRSLGRRDKAVWGALKGISDDDLAIHLLVAGISVGGSDELGADRDGQKTFRDTALWIGRNLCPRHGAETRLKVGAWGINLLLEALPSFFALTATDVLFLTGSVYDLMDEVTARAVRSNPFLTPLTEPPQAWTGVLDGGLPPKHWARVPLIREHHRSIEHAARKAIGTGRMQPALDAINTLQSVPFTINEPVLDFLFRATAPDALPELRVWEMEALDQGPNFITRLPLTVDATCSGLQHLCAMTRALEGLYVNLIPGEDPDDFYRRVAYRVWDLGNNQVRALMDGPFDRKIVKQPAMSYFYGSRAGGFTKDKKGRWHPYGMTKQIIEVLKERGKSTKGAKELAHAIYNEIEGMVPRAKAVRDFLERLAKLCADEGKPLRWPTPLGHSVLNEYHPPDDKDIEVRLNGRRKTTTLVIGDKEGISRTKAVNAVTANFVHSVDAAHLQFVALAAAKDGIGMVSVHDCFGCLAPRAGRFNQIILEQFVRLHEKHNLLNEVRESARRDLPKSIELPPLPEIGCLEIKAIPQTLNAYK